MPIGCKVTLRGTRMYEFLDRLISLALPRVRDFRGLNPTAFDGHGNYSLGLTEQLVFPGIEPGQVHAAAGDECDHRHHGATATTKPASCCEDSGMPFKRDGADDAAKSRREIAGATSVAAQLVK